MAAPRTATLRFALVLAALGCARAGLVSTRDRADAGRVSAPFPLADGSVPDTEVEEHRPLSGPLAACVTRVRERMPPEIAAALVAIEYPAIAEDACRLDLAVASRDLALCERVRLSALRDTCRMRAAIATGHIEACPRAPPDRGRDPVCVALAARSPALCAAATRPDALRCLAIARGTPAQCEALDPLLRPRCLGDLAALAPVLPRMNGAPLRPGTVHLRLATSASLGPDAGLAREWDLDLAARGAYADESGTIYLVDPWRGWPSEFAMSLSSEQPIVALALAPPRRPGPGRLIDLRVVLPNGMVFAPVMGGRVEVHFAHVPGGRGSEIDGSVEADVVAPGVPAHLTLSFRTFVRDVVDPRDLGRE